MVFGPGTKVTDAAVKLIEMLEKKKWFIRIYLNLSSKTLNITKIY